MRAAGQIRKLRQTRGMAPNRRERRKLATRQAILDATQALLASRSMDALTVDEIAMQADVAKGTFYNYFPDKDGLSRSCVRTFARAWKARSRAQMKESAIPQRESRAHYAAYSIFASARRHRRR